jgi:membrane protease YdiL (CAAX protease family)
MAAAMRTHTLWRLLGLTVAMAGPGLVAGATRALGEPGSVAMPLAGLAALWGLLALLLVIVTRGERESLASIGLVKLRLSSVALGIALAAALILVMRLVLPLLAHYGLVDLSQGMAEVAAWPVWLRLIAVITAGVVEEALWRGYALTRLAAMTGNTLFGAALSIAAFAIVHVPFWGPGIIVPVVLGSVISIAVFLWRRDLAIVAVAHALTDGNGLIIEPLLAAR